MKQTAIEWLIEQLENSNVISKYAFPEMIEQAKAMEKEQIIESWDNGWKRANETKDKSYSTAEDYGFNYYNETFKSE